MPKEIKFGKIENDVFYVESFPKDKDSIENFQEIIKNEKIKKIVCTGRETMVGNHPAVGIFKRGIQSVELSGATNLGKSTFVGSELEEVILPKVTRIGDHAFKDCKKLIAVTAPNAHTFGKEIFEGCENLKIVDLSSFPNGFSANNKLFVGCGKLSLDDSKFGTGMLWIPTTCFPNLDITPMNVSRLQFKKSKTGVEKVKLIDDKFSVDNSAAVVFRNGKRYFQKTDDTIKDSIVDSEFGAQLEELAGYNWTPKLTDIKQAGIGDCWLLAALAGLAKTNPTAIKNCIKISKQKDHAIVTLYKTEHLGVGPFYGNSVFNPKSQLKIKIPLFQFKMLKPSDSALWVMIFEKAFAVLLSVRNTRTTYNTKKEEYAFLNYMAINGNSSAFALASITGKKYKSIRDINSTIEKEKVTSSNEKNLYNKIKNKLVSGYVITADSEEKIENVEILKIIEPNHAYTVLSVEEKGNQKMITLYNPHGSELTISFNDFIDSFTTLGFMKKKQ